VVAVEVKEIILMEEVVVLAVAEGLHKALITVEVLELLDKEILALLASLHQTCLE
jgi:hypothetical protein